MSRDFVSIIMNCRNGAAYVADAVASVRSQTHADWEIIFWNNASTDASREIVAGLGDPRIRIFDAPQVEPLGRARSLAFAEARGNFLAMLDVDDCWLPDLLSAQLHCFRNDPRLSLVYSDCTIFGGGREFQHFGRWQPPQGDIFAALLRRYFLFSLTVLVKREALGDRPWFDAGLDICHDKHLFLRAARAGHGAYVPVPLARHRLHRNSFSRMRHEQAVREDEQVLALCEREWPGLAEEQAEAIASYRTELGWRRALSEWQSGRGRAARQHLVALAGATPRACALYLLSFLPAAWWDGMRNFYQARVGRGRMHHPAEAGPRMAAARE